VMPVKAKVNKKILDYSLNLTMKKSGYGFKILIRIGKRGNYILMRNRKGSVIEVAVKKFVPVGKAQNKK
jgi:hypothetical protein